MIEAFVFALVVNIGAGVLLVRRLRDGDLGNDITDRWYPTGQVRRRANRLPSMRPRRYQARHRAPDETDHMQGEAAL